MLYFTAVKRLVLFEIILLTAAVLPSYGATDQNPSTTAVVMSPQNKPSPIRPKTKKLNSAVPVKNENTSLYTVKAGDTMYRILMREYGLTGRQAVRFVEVIRRENKISDFRRLRIGQKITISSMNRKSSGGSLSRAGNGTQANVNTVTPKVADQLSAPTQMLALEKPPLPVRRDSDVTTSVKQMWEKILPGQSTKNTPSLVSSGGVSIALDPDQYPVLAAMDGSRIIVDAKGKIPPSIKAFHANADPGLQIVSESAANRKKFLASLTEAGRFYSVEENFVMEFGADPKLTVHSDFRVEKTAESVANHDVVLLNAGEVASSPALMSFLKKEGFAVYEPFALIKPHVFPQRNRLIQITTNQPPDIAGSILKALSITPKENARINIAGVDNDGISISITPDHYFHYKGKTYCITYNNKDTSAFSSLIPIMQAKGINPIILNQNDTFREISERILTGVGLSGSYGFHSLWPKEDSGYSLQMSGIMVENAGASGESLFLTDRDIDRIIREISTENGLIVENQ